MPFFWGTDSEGHLVLSDDADIVKQGCGKSFAPFPKGNADELLALKGKVLEAAYIVFHFCF